MEPTAERESVTPDPDVSTAVRKLRDAVRARVEALRRDPAWRPVAHPHVRIEFPRFNYGAGGISDHDLRWFGVTKDLWIGDPLDRAMAGTQPDIEAAAASLSGLNPHASTVLRAVAALCGWLMLDELQGTGVPDDEVERRAERLFRSLRALPVRAWVDADLVGVAVLCPPLEFDTPDGVRVSLRALGPDDLGGDTYLEWAEAALRRVQSHPSALLRLEYEATDGAGWQPPLEGAVAILRLFGVGGVAWTRVESGTESLVDVHGGIVHLDQDGGSRRTYAIDVAGAARLPRFWEGVGAALPRKFYWHPPEDPVAIDRAWFNYKAAAGRFGYVDERRVGQVNRSLRSQLNLGEVDVHEFGLIGVLGQGKKRGEVVHLHPELRACIDECLSERGHLWELERAYQAGEIDDYYLWQKGRMRKDRRAGVMRIPLERHLTNPGPLDSGSLIDLFREFETMCGVQHVSGRSFYGLRRALSDIAPEYTSDPRALDRLTGHDDPATRERRYQDRLRVEDREEAAAARREMRTDLVAGRLPEKRQRKRRQRETTPTEDAARMRATIQRVMGVEISAEQAQEILGAF